MEHLKIYIKQLNEAWPNNSLHKVPPSYVTRKSLLLWLKRFIMWAGIKNHPVLWRWRQEALHLICKCPPKLQDTPVLPLRCSHSTHLNNPEKPEDPSGSTPYDPSEKDTKRPPTAPEHRTKPRTPPFPRMSRSSTNTRGNPHGVLHSMGVASGGVCPWWLVSWPVYPAQPEHLTWFCPLWV